MITLSSSAALFTVLSGMVDMLPISLLNAMRGDFFPKKESCRFDKKLVIMKKTSTYLAAIGGITLFAASVLPASADPRHGNAHWGRHNGGRYIIFGVKPRRHLNDGRHYFGDDPGRYFGVGPGSYECYGYDCTW